jgi:hypothetical protein
VLVLDLSSSSVFPAFAEEKRRKEKRRSSTSHEHEHEHEKDDEYDTTIRAMFSAWPMSR